MKNTITIEGQTYVKVNKNKLPKFRTEKGTLKNIEAIYLEHGNVGTVFYTDKKSNTVTSYANLYKRKIKTEYLYAIPKTNGVGNSFHLMKVTILI